MDVDDLQPTDVQKYVVKFGSVPNGESIGGLINKARDFIYDNFGE
jgi:hypothetical protein